MADQVVRTQRAALEALATTLESMEEDARIAAREFRAATQTTKAFMAALEKEALAVTNERVPAAETFTVMLASSSKWRRALIAEILPEGFELAENPISPDINEKAIRREDPEDMVKAIAHAKADKVLSVLESTHRKEKVHLVVCADQVVEYDNQVREKPLTKEQAKDHLQSYGANAKPAKCITGVVVVCTATQERFEGTDVALQYFKPVPDRVADALIAKGDIMHCAGSFVVEDPLMIPYLEKRVGEVESVQGMPRGTTRRLLLEASVALKKHLHESKRTRRS
jgi:septum formation protein